MLSSSSWTPPTKLSMSPWIAPSLMNFSVDAHQTITSRSQSFSSLKRRMSLRIDSTEATLEPVALMFVPLMART